MTTDADPINVPNQSGGLDISAEQANVGGDAVGRDKISVTNITNVYPSGKDEAQPLEKRFLIGKQLRIVRDDTGLQPPGFIELIDFHSEQQYRDMEANKTECPESVIGRIYEATGILPGWLKDPSKQKYEIELADDWIRQPKETARRIAQLATEYIYVTVAASIPAKDRLLWRSQNLLARMTDDYLHVGVCVPVSAHRYRVFDTGFAAHFANAYDQERYALPFYLFLYELFEHLGVNCVGVILSGLWADKALYQGKVYPRKILSSHNAFGRINWVRQVLAQQDDRNQTYVIKNCGQWIGDIQRVFLELGNNARR